MNWQADDIQVDAWKELIVEPPSTQETGPPRKPGRFTAAAMDSARDGRARLGGGGEVAE